MELDRRSAVFIFVGQVVYHVHNHILKKGITRWNKLKLILIVLFMTSLPCGVIEYSALTRTKLIKLTTF